MTEELVFVVLLKLFQLSAGIILCFVGKSLLEKGVRADFFGEGEILSKKLRIITSSPGLVFLVAGLGIIIATIFTQAKIEQVEPGTRTSVRFMDKSQETNLSPNAKEELKPTARIVISLASIYADSIDTKSIDSSTSQSILEQLKIGRAGRTNAEITKMLNTLIDKDPKSLANMIKAPSYRWIMHDDEVVA